MSTNPLQPWELRDQRFRESQAARDNGQRSGTTAPLPLQQYQQGEDTDAAQQRLSDARDLGGGAAEPSLARRGLSHEIKARMIELFAHFQSVKQVQDAIKSEFGLALDARTVEVYNPDSIRCVCGKRLKSLFILQRKAYVEECAKVAVSHQAHRLRLIGTIVEKAEKAKDFGNALKGLELAAKEMGGLSQTIEHKGMVAHVHGTVEDARRELADRLRQLIPVVEVETTAANVETTAANVETTAANVETTAANVETTLDVEAAPVVPTEDGSASTL